MGRVQWHQPILRGAKTTLFLLAVCLVSTVMVMGSSRTTRAESLLYTVRCTVSALLSRACQQTPAPTSPTPATTQPTEQSSSQAPATTPTPVVTETAPPLQTAEPIAADLPTIPATTRALQTQQSYQFPSQVMLASYANRATAQDVLGVSISEHSALEATPQGWRLFGLLWYWWMLIIGVIFTGLAFLKSSVLKSFPSIVKPS